MDLCADAVLLTFRRAAARGNGRFCDLGDLRRAPRPGSDRTCRRAGLDRQATDLCLLAEVGYRQNHRGMLSLRELAVITTLHGVQPARWHGSIADLVPRRSLSARTSCIPVRGHPDPGRPPVNAPAPCPLGLASDGTGIVTACAQRSELPSAYALGLDSRVGVDQVDPGEACGERDRLAVPCSVRQLSYRPAKEVFRNQGRPCASPASFGLALGRTRSETTWLPNGPRRCPRRPAGRRTEWG